MGIIDLHGIQLQFSTSDNILYQAWLALFAGWSAADKPIGQGEIKIECHLVDELPPLPRSVPIYADNDAPNMRANRLTVFATSVDTSFQIAFADMGLVKVDVERSLIKAKIHRDCLRTGRFPDLIFTSLAPILRRHQIFLLHSFGLQRGAQTRLLLGPNGSGKSSCGMAHVLAGWRFLGNDLLMVKSLPDGVWCWPSPGEVAVRPDTLERLPALNAWVVDDIVDENAQRRLDSDLIRRQHGGQAASVNQIYLTELSPKKSHKQPVTAAVALVQLMTNSVDRWDAPMFAEHMAVLRLLVEGAECARFAIGPELGTV